MTLPRAQDQLLSAAFVEDSIDTYLARHGRLGRWLYLTLVGGVVAVGALLPMITVQPSVRSAGVVRPETEKQDVRARTAGVVERVTLRENAAVRQGDTLALLRAGALDERRALLGTRIDEARRLAADLETLARRPLPLASAAVLQTPALRGEHAAYVEAIGEYTPRLEQATRELARMRALAAQGAATASEVDEKTFAVAGIESERTSARARHVSAWETRLAAARAELESLEAERRQAVEENTLYAVVAPVTGTLEQVASLSPGSFLASADRLAVISPASKLVADVDVRPADIGQVHVGMPVRLRVDAFDATDWGFVSGRVTEISNDAVPVNGAPAFRVKVALEQEQLTLRTGFVGHIKKGMTLQARFMLAERSLWQLLFDDVSDWLDPNRAPQVAAGVSR